MKQVNQNDQGPLEKLQAVNTVKQDLAEKFLVMGYLLSEVKRGKLFHYNAYESFGDWVQCEHNLPLKSANKLIKLHRLYVDDMEQDEQTLAEIGMDRLMMIAPMVEKAPWETREELLQMAADLPIPQLKEELAKRKAEAAPETPTDLKKVLVDQWKEWFTGAFNASWSEVQFKLALWFSSPTKCDPSFLKAMKEDIRVLQARFEEEAGNADR